MHRSFLVAILCCSLLFSAMCLAQTDSTNVIVHADARLSLLFKKETAPVRTAEVPKAAIETASTPGADASPVVRRTPVTLYAGKGYRVQLYNGPDRNEATAVKAAFTRRFPGVRSYLTYVAPSFRVKVGDFRTRSEAEAMMKQARDLHSPVMIVPDEITIIGYQ